LNPVTDVHQRKVLIFSHLLEASEGDSNMQAAACGYRKKFADREF
jgi:hypothetical protein